jgi:methylmalonyl-CoA/ethylmalonyl-CoA epimerase
MTNLRNRLQGLELAQIGWVVPDINTAINFFAKSLSLAEFPKPALVHAEDINLFFYGEVVAAQWLTCQLYNGSTFIELIQPISGRSMFQDFLDRYPLGGVQHLAYRLPIEGFDKIVSGLREAGYSIISEVDHPIARMVFFDTYQVVGVATEIMGITPKGWSAIEQMQK